MACSKVKINHQQLPIKAHWFFFMAAMGPILPYLFVYGKQLGISPDIMGSITGILPILYLISKPMFGYLVDYFRNQRKMIFIGILITTSLSFILLYFLPYRSVFKKNVILSENISLSLHCHHDKSELCMFNEFDQSNETDEIEMKCWWNCGNNSTSLIKLSKSSADQRNSSCSFPICFIKNIINDCDHVKCDLIRYSRDKQYDPNIYKTFSFWVFVILMSIGSIGFNVTNSISDAICFDVLGEDGRMGYGRQRVWGTIGFGIAALISGCSMDIYSQSQEIKSYTPAFILVGIFTVVDVFCCLKLELPVMSGSDSILKDVLKLLKIRTIAIFLVFATLAGILDSFVIYYLFWFLDDLAQMTNFKSQINTIGGFVVAAETLVGEVIFFSISGKILKKLGYGYTMTICFISYGLRFLFLSLIPNPWWAVLVELFMQGLSYALCYTIIVGFASAIAPPGTSATVQGIIAGMDDGFGFAVGSFIGGILYKNLGGHVTLKLYSGLAFITAIFYLIVYIFILKKDMPNTKKRSPDVKWQRPEDAMKELEEF